MFDSIEGFLDAMGFAPKVEPEPLREPPPGTDSIEDFLATGIGPEEEPEPLREPSVPTTPVLGRHLESWNPFSEGPLSSELELRRRFYRELFQRGPYSLTPFLRGDVKVSLVGAYCLFYVGREWDLYAPICSEASTLAIYVGEAVYTSLGRRLQEHAQSIQQQGLGLENFTCRFIGLPDWFDGEQMLLRDFAPLWNKHLTGFGSHRQRTDSRGGSSKISDWDLVHQYLTKQKRKGCPVSVGRSVESILQTLNVGMGESLVMYHRGKEVYTGGGKADTQP